MKNTLKFALASVTFCFIFQQCDIKPEKITHEQENQAVEVITDRLIDMANISEFVIYDSIHSEKMNLVINSVSKNEFIQAMRENSANLRLFDKTLKVNEFLPKNRKDLVLQLGNEIDYIYLADIADSKFFRARNYFYEGRINGYHVVKRIQFEDKETIFVNDTSFNEDFVFNGLSLSLNMSSKLFLFCNTFRITNDDDYELSIFKIENGILDTLINTETSWFTEFSFFDNKKNTVYYIHSFFEGQELKSTYAKMDYFFKQ